jgi:hypothetical protein
MLRRNVNTGGGVVIYSLVDTLVTLVTECGA